MVMLQLFDILVARRLSVDGYSEWAYFFSILSLLFFVGWFGIGSSARISASTAVSAQEKKEFVKASLVLQLAVTAVVALLLFLFAQPLAALLGYPERYPRLLTLLRIGSGILFLSAYMELFKNLYQGLEEYRLLALMTFTEYAGYLVFAAVFLCLSSDVTAVALAYAAGGAFTVGADFFCLYRKMPLRNTSFQKQKMNALMKYAIPMLAISVGAILLAELDVIMLGILGSKTDVSFYSIAKRLCDKATHLNESIAAGTVTSLAILNRDNLEERKAQFRKLDRMNLAASAVAVAALAGIAVVFIPVFYGDAYQGATSVMLTLLPYYVLIGISSLYGRMVDMYGGAWGRSAWFLSAIVLDLVLNCLLIPRWGAYGAALATNLSLIPYTVYTVAALGRIYKTIRSS